MPIAVHNAKAKSIHPREKSHHKGRTKERERTCRLYIQTALHHNCHSFQDVKKSLPKKHDFSVHLPVSQIMGLSRRTPTSMR